MIEIIELFFDNLYEVSKNAMNLMFMNFQKNGTRITDMW